MANPTKSWKEIIFQIMARKINVSMYNVVILLAPREPIKIAFWVENCKNRWIYKIVSRLPS